VAQGTACGLEHRHYCAHCARRELDATDVAVSGDVGDVEFTTPDGLPAPTTNGISQTMNTAGSVRTGARGKEAKDDGPKLALWAGRHPWWQCLIVDVRGSQPIQLRSARS
jgi:hypothetical protein